MDGFGHVSLDGITLKLMWAQGRADAQQKINVLDGWELIREACGYPREKVPAQEAYEDGFLSVVAPSQCKRLFEILPEHEVEGPFPDMMTAPPRRQRSVTPPPLPPLPKIVQSGSIGDIRRERR